jgi:hypothetical protein
LEASVRYAVSDRVVNVKTGRRGTVALAHEFEYSVEGYCEEFLIAWDGDSGLTAYSIAGPRKKKPFSIEHVEPIRRADA